MRRQRLPSLFENGPFTRAEARAVGLERWHLETARWRRVGPRVYAPADLPDSPATGLLAARHRLPPVAAFSGFTAAWLHGLDVPPCNPIEVTIPKGAGVSARAGLAVCRAGLNPEDVVLVDGLRVTSPLRTTVDLASRLDLVEAVVILDMALRAELVDLEKLAVEAEARAGHRGARNFREALALAEPATESPMETRLRLLLVRAGLPKPEVQPTIYDVEGRFVARLDLFYPDVALGIEYDGGTHHHSLVDDDRRQNRLLSVGIRLLRFTKADVYHTPELTAAQTRFERQRAASAGSRGTFVMENAAGAGTRATVAPSRPSPRRFP